MMNTLYIPTVHYDSHWTLGGCWTPEMGPMQPMD